jgi:hypothetical protein
MGADVPDPGPLQQTCKAAGSGPHGSRRSLMPNERSFGIHDCSERLLSAGASATLARTLVLNRARQEATAMKTQPISSLACTCR